MLAQAQAAQKDFAGAIQSSQKATALNPNDVDAMILLARMQLARGTPDDAMATFEQAIQKNPRDPRPYVLLGTLEEGQNNWQQAEQHYQKALEMQPDYPPAANNLAYLLLQHGGSVDLALSLAQTASRAMPDSPNADDTLALAYIRKGNYQLAVAPLEDSVKKVPQDQSVQYHLGLAYQGMKEMAKAKVSFQRALAIDPKSSVAEEIRKSLAEISN
jgi:Flp pilus assembly protein TadD